MITDHSNLRWLHNLKNPTGRLARWTLELLEYDYAVEHQKGVLHHVPGALFRAFESENDLMVNAVKPEDCPEIGTRRRVISKKIRGSRL